MRKLKKENRMTVLLSPTGSPRSSTLELPPAFEKISGSSGAKTISLGSLGLHRQRQTIIPQDVFNQKLRNSHLIPGRKLLSSRCCERA
jgi:hypothetical protein